MGLQGLAVVKREASVTRVIGQAHRDVLRTAVGQGPLAGSGCRANYCRAIRPVTPGAGLFYVHEATGLEPGGTPDGAVAEVVPSAGRSPWLLHGHLPQQRWLLIEVAREPVAACPGCVFSMGDAQCGLVIVAEGASGPGRRFMIGGDDVDYLVAELKGKLAKAA
jgi:hypothetical protein